MGEKAREFVRENFLLTRQLREYLTLMLAIQQEIHVDRIDPGGYDKRLILRNDVHHRLGRRDDRLQ